MNFRLVREALRRARAFAPAERNGVPRVGMTLNEAADASGLNRATIHSIENIKREPNLKPELETIERLARTYGLTLSSFFAKIESREGGHETGIPGSHSRKGGRSDHAVSAAPSEETTDMDRELGRAIARIVQVELTRRQVAATGTRGPGGRKTHRKNR